MVTITISSISFNSDFGKTEVLYTDFFDHLDSLAQSDPHSILCDYEKGLHIALHSIFPSATIRGCYFHFKQVLWRKMQAFELVPGLTCEEMV